MTASSSPSMTPTASTQSQPTASAANSKTETTSDAKSTTVPPPSNNSRALQNRLGTRQVGDPPPFDRLIVGGTFSLGLLLLIGGIVILAVSLADQSEFKDASLNDFVSLGDEACQILNTSSYRFVDEELNALNTRCMEEYRYNVKVVSDAATSSSDGDKFVSNVLKSVVCPLPCGYCNEVEFRGPTYYTGVIINENGETISSNTLVECWAPRTDFISDFYSCPPPTESDAVPCYQLQDPSIPLKEAEDSNQLGMIAAWVGLVGSVVFIALGVWFVRRNRLVLKQDAELLAAAQDAEKEPTGVSERNDMTQRMASNDELA